MPRWVWPINICNLARPSPFQCVYRGMLQIPAKSCMANKHRHPHRNRQRRKRATAAAADWQYHHPKSSSMCRQSTYPKRNPGPQCTSTRCCQHSAKAHSIPKQLVSYCTAAARSSTSMLQPGSRPGPTEYNHSFNWLHDTAWPQSLQ